MANKALNQVSQVQSTELANVKTFLAVMNNGEIKQMSKESLASVVGGLYFIASLTEETIDFTIRQGIYNVGFAVSGANNDFGVLIVINTNTEYKTQLLLGKRGFHHRTITSGSNFVDVAWIN